MIKYLTLSRLWQLKFELYRAKNEFSIGLELNNDFENTIIVKCTIPFLFKTFISLDCPLCKTKWWRKFLFLDDDHKYDGRSLSLSVFEADYILDKTYYFSLDIFTYPYCWPGGISVFKNLAETIYGDYKYENEIKKTTKTKVFIPGVGGYKDNIYELLIHEMHSTWTWKRFNKKSYLIRYEVECEEGCEHRIKWGMQDALFSLTTQADSPQDAVNKFIENVQEDRLKY